MLEVTNLSLNFGSKLILRNVSFSALQGELIYVLGRNGTGKSSLLKCISGLQKFQGKVKIGQKSISDYSTQELATKIALVLPTLSDSAHNLNVYEAVSLGRTPYLSWLAKLQEKDQEIIEKAISITQIRHLLDKNLSQLSDGERQRVMIARAIAQDTPIIIADEPTAFLDVYFRKQILELFKQITQNEGKTILLSTHEIELALACANKILLLGNAQQFLFLDKWQKDEVWQFLEGKEDVFAKNKM
ncbi:MAG: ABC transporter ATP-binding protein [Raineya sp.]|nr:ABC transporter ATP-binding protein [Raineya sp.]MDW8296537.1 ABC transporter ATP-binding protein [Raineya sp.]